MSVKCPKCSFDNTAKTLFCGRCGTRIDRGLGGMAAPTEIIDTSCASLGSGALFAGRFQIIEELGCGGMGRVYRALDRSIDEEVALKIIRPEVASDRNTLDRFRSELRTARRISHKHIGHMYELMDENGTYFITMEYIPGEDLKSAIRRFGQLPVGKALAVAIQICEGLAEAHNLGIVHRDLKPGNIMIDLAGNARVLDFGIARSVREKGITDEGVLIGTPEYMSPEQAEAAEVDHRSDLYSLGILLFEMATGRVPFEGETALGVAMMHRSERPPNPRTLNQEISDEFAAVILRCLEKERSRRFQTAEELLAALRAVERLIPETQRAAARRPLNSREITVTFRLRKLVFPAAGFIAIAAVGLLLWKALPRQEDGAPIPADPRETAMIRGSSETRQSGTWAGSVAVLPFADLSPERDREYFCDGMIEAIIGQLSRIDDLKVISRTSVVTYRNSPKLPRDIARELGVTHVLEGSIQREDDAIRVTAQLIDAESGFQVWSGKYDRAMTGVFAIQDEISQAIAGALKLELSPDARAAGEAVRPDDMDLYETYLQGMYFISSKYVLTYQDEDFIQAVRKLEEAKAMAPDYAQTYLGLAWAYWHRYQITNNPDDLARLFDNIETAYRLKPDLAESNMGKAFVHFWEGDIDQAFEKYRIALERGRNRYEVHMAVGYTYQRMGLYEQAMPFFRKVTELAPFYLYGRYNLAWCHLYMGEIEQAESLLREALAINPHNPFSLLYLATCLLQAGKTYEATQIFAELEETAPDFYLLPTYKAYLHASRGDEAKALELNRHSSVYSLLGMNDEAIESMRKAMQEGTIPPYLRLIHDPFYDRLRSDPRFMEIVTLARKTHEELVGEHGEIGITL